MLAALLEFLGSFFAFGGSEAAGAGPRIARVIGLVAVIIILLLAITWVITAVL